MLIIRPNIFIQWTAYGKNGEPGQHAVGPVGWDLEYK